MEEDIKILENAIYEMQELIEVYEEQGNVEDKEGLLEVQQAIENLIARYKELRTHYEIICDDLEEHNLIYTDTPEFEEQFINRDKIIKILEEYKNIEVIDAYKLINFYKKIKELGR